MKIIYKDTEIYPFKTIFEAEKHAAKLNREIYSVFATQGGTIIYSFFADNQKFWVDRSGDLPQGFEAYNALGPMPAQTENQNEKL